MRVFSSPALDALASGRFARRHMVRFDLEPDAVGFWDDIYDVTYESQLYWGAANRFTISPFASVSDQSVSGVEVTFSGLDVAVANEVETADYHQRPMQVFVAILSTVDNSFIAVKSFFSGFVDQVVRREQTGRADLIVRCETISRELDRSGTRTRSDADQQSFFSGDKFFEHVAPSITRNIVWGRKGPQRPVAGRR